MATIRDHVRSFLGETYGKLDTAGYDQSSGKPDAVGLKVGAAMSQFFDDGKLEADISEFSRYFLAMGVTRSLIPLAIDYYMVNTRINENMNRPAGVTPLGGESVTNYNRVQALENLNGMLASLIAEALADFVAENKLDLRTSTAKAGARVSSDGTFLTDDPKRTFWSPRAPLIAGSEFGVYFGVVPDQPYIIDLNDV